MQCAHWQEAISARIDGEDPGVEPRLLDAHVATCADCRAFTSTAERARRLARVQPAPEIPDLSRRVVKAAALADRVASWSAVRAVLAVVALQVVGFALRPLVWGTDGAAATHEARHIGAFSVAYGVGLLAVVVRPARARTMLPVAAVLAATLTITAVVDMTNGDVPAIAEASHLPEVLSVVLIWLIASPARRRGNRDTAAPLPSRTLRAVARDESPARADGTSSGSGA